MSVHERARRLIVGCALVLSQVGADGGGCGPGNPPLRDPGFDLWCGDQLCAWKVVRGEVTRVGTWHEGDSGVELVGTDSAIQQLSPFNSDDGTCIEFSLIANVEATAEVFLEIDLQADGTVERSERIPTSSWKPIKFLISIAGVYDGIRFELAKHGNGNAVLAQIGGKRSFDCAGLSTISAGPRPPGSACGIADDCPTGICKDSPLPRVDRAPIGTVCMGCDPAAPACAGGEVCGLGDPLSSVLGVPVQCVPAGRRELGELCIADAECISGICSSLADGEIGTCSACDSVDDCGGERCGPSYLFGPFVCQAGEMVGAPGSPCGANADCASGTCTGDPRRTCQDARPCATETNCPMEDGFDPGACTTVGVQGGICD